MGRKKKAPADDGGDDRFNVSCKLRSRFADKLRMVADDFGQVPGDLIERHMADWIETEYERILRRKLAELEKESARGRPAK